jgi:ABC-type xylose transport system permease subunit
MFEFVAIDSLVVCGGAMLGILGATALPPDSRRWWVAVLVTSIVFFGLTAAAQALFGQLSDPATLVAATFAGGCTLICGVVSYFARKLGAPARLILVAVVMAPFLFITPPALLIANGGL